MIKVGTKVAFSPEYLSQITPIMEDPEDRGEIVSLHDQFAVVRWESGYCSSLNLSSLTVTNDHA